MFRLRSMLVTVLFFYCAMPNAVARDATLVKTIPVADGIYMLVGHGGNIAVSKGSNGVLVIDDQYASQYETIKQAINDIAPGGVKFLINTHWHSDHTGGNEQMANSGAIIVAHENVRQRLRTDQVIEFFNAGRPASPATAWPIITFTEDIKFHFNDNEIDVFHVRDAHTDGDAVVHFTNANVIHTGDIFFHGLYPFIDSGSGGSISGMIAAVERILALCDENTRVIPGHGDLTDKHGLEEYRNMLKSVQNSIADLIVAGRTSEQVVLAKPTAMFDARWGGGFLKPDTFVKMVYDNIRRTTIE